MFMEERQKDIVRRVNESGRILVSEIRELYQVSADCARRDLRVLESRGLLQRTHGGAIAIAPGGAFPSATYNPVDVQEPRPDYLAVARRALSISRPMRSFTSPPLWWGIIWPGTCRRTCP